MFFRGRSPEPSVWRRFRSGFDGFTFVKEDEYYAAHIVANAERVVDLFHALTEQMPPAVDVYVEDLRSSRSWKGENVALPDVRERLLVAGIEPAPPMTPEQFGDYLRAEVVKWGKVVKAADITVQTF